MRYVHYQRALKLQQKTHLLMLLILLTSKGKGGMLCLVSFYVLFTISSFCSNSSHSSSLGVFPLLSLIYILSLYLTDTMEHSLLSHVVSFSLPTTDFLVQFFVYLRYIINMPASSCLVGILGSVVHCILLIYEWVNNRTDLDRI